MSHLLSLALTLDEDVALNFARQNRGGNGDEESVGISDASDGNIDRVMEALHPHGPRKDCSLPLPESHPLPQEVLLRSTSQYLLPRSDQQGYYHHLSVEWPHPEALWILKDLPRSQGIKKDPWLLHLSPAPVSAAPLRSPHPTRKL